MAGKSRNIWNEIEALTKQAALETLRRHEAQGDAAPGAMAVQEMTLGLTQMGWKVTRWIDEDLKRRGK